MRLTSFLHSPLLKICMYLCVLRREHLLQFIMFITKTPKIQIGIHRAGVENGSIPFKKVRQFNKLPKAQVICVTHSLLKNNGK